MVQLSRPKIIACRWILIILYATIASTFWLLLHPFASPSLEATAHMLAQLPVEVLMFATILGALATSRWLSHGRCLGFGCLYASIAYPPLWVAVLIGVVMITVAGEFFSTGYFALHPDATSNSVPKLSAVLYDVPKWIWAVLGLPFVAFPLIGALPRLEAANEGGDSDEVQPATNSVYDLSFDELRQWVGTDDPIKESRHDHFGHAQTAERIVQRLLDPNRPTVALIGPLGSGKTSIRKLVEARIPSHEATEVVAISIWQFDTPQAAIAGILDCLLAALGKHVNCFELQGVSAVYLDAIEQSAGAWGGLVRLGRAPQAPEELLQEFDRLASAADRRFILWIEDLERFAGAINLSPEAAAEREADRLSAIRAMLFHLNECTQVSVVVADASLSARFDVTKIARYIEQAPRMSSDAVCSILDRVRLRCLSGWPKQVIDVLPVENRIKLAVKDDPIGMRRYLDAVRDDEPELRLAMSQLIDTPRNLKAVLRLVLESWDSLAGEVDIDAVIVASILRIGCPEVFAFIVESIVLCQEGLYRNHPPGSKDRKLHSKGERLIKLFQSDQYIYRERAVRVLLESLFPGILETDSDRRSHMVRLPQSFAVGRDKYWLRYVSGRLIDSDEPDQDVLRCIQDWKNNRQESLVDRLFDSERADAIVHFAGQFDSRDFGELLQVISERIANQPMLRVSDTGVPGLSTMWRMYIGRQIVVDQHDAATALRHAFQMLAPGRLDVVVWLFGHFIVPTGIGVFSAVGDQQARELASMIAHHLLGVEQADGWNKYVKSVGRDDPRITLLLLNYLACFLSENNGNDFFPGAHRVGALLRQVLAHEPEIGTRIVARLLARTEVERVHGPGMSGSTVYRGAFNATYFTRIFGEDTETLRLMSAQQVPVNVSEEERAGIEAAISGARERLEMLDATTGKRAGADSEA